MKPRFATLLGLSLVAAGLWWYVLSGLATLAGKLWRLRRPGGASELLDAAL